MEAAPIKDPEEIVDVSANFADELGAAAIQGAPVVSVSVVDGVDADPANTLQGAPSVDGTIVFQRMRLGLSKVEYKYRFKITASDGRVLVLVKHVAVRAL